MKHKVKIEVTGKHGDYSFKIIHSSKHTKGNIISTKRYVNKERCMMSAWDTYHKIFNHDELEGVLR